VIYLYLDRLSQWLTGRRAAEPRAERRGAAGAPLGATHAPRR